MNEKIFDTIMRNIEQRVGHLDGEPQAGRPLNDPMTTEEQLVTALKGLMEAYERRVRTDCTTPEDLGKQPWRCAEYITAERVLHALLTPTPPKPERQ